MIEGKKIVEFTPSNKGGNVDLGVSAMPNVKKDFRTNIFSIQFPKEGVYLIDPELEPGINFHPRGPPGYDIGGVITLYADFETYGVAGYEATALGLKLGSCNPGWPFKWAFFDGAILRVWFTPWGGDFDASKSDLIIRMIEEGESDKRFKPPCPKIKD